jgi:hypothetical protein
MKLPLTALAMYALLFYPQQQTSSVVQLDISSIYNARPVTTLTGKTIVPWVKGIDIGGIGDGYATMAASVAIGDIQPHALPDNPLIAANNQHPEVLLHYNNSDSTHKQAVAVIGESGVTFAVKQAKYKDLYLALTSAEGASALKITLTYTDGTETKDFTLPDYYRDLPANDPDLCYLVHDLAKWGTKNNMTEKDHHNIDLLNVHPNPAKTLKGISINKTKPGYLVFWATGVK